MQNGLLVTGIAIPAEKDFHASLFGLHICVRRMEVDMRRAVMLGPRLIMVAIRHETLLRMAMKRYDGENVAVFGVLLTAVRREEVSQTGI